MNRLIATALVALLALDAAAPAFAARVRVVHRGPRHRTVVVVHRHFPIRRAMPRVVVHAPRVTVRIAPAAFVAPVVWSQTVVTAMPAPAALVWEDSEILAREDEWTEFTLDANARGTKLYLEIVGKAQLNFAEVVFENGDAQVVDFEEKSHGTGLYSLLDFAAGRKVDHVRMVARARSDEARIVLRLS
jgi:hypothetical protein